ncbi:MAG: hypothetical protein AAF907_09835 [Planctomycetota bacterium]
MRASPGANRLLSDLSAAAKSPLPSAYPSVPANLAQALHDGSNPGHDAAKPDVRRLAGLAAGVLGGGVLCLAGFVGVLCAAAVYGGFLPAPSPELALLLVGGVGLVAGLLNVYAWTVTAGHVLSEEHAAGRL